MGVQAGQFDPRGGQAAADGLGGFAVLDVETKLAVGMRGLDVGVGIDRQVGGDAQPDARPFIGFSG